MAYGQQYRRAAAPRQSFTGVKMSKPVIPQEFEASPAQLQQAQALAKQVVSNHPSHGGPLKSFRSGALQVAVWENEGMDQDGNVFVTQSVTFERRYKDKNGEWKSTNSLKANDLPKAVLLLSKAYEYLVLQGDAE